MSDLVTQVIVTQRASSSKMSDLSKELEVFQQQKQAAGHEAKPLDELNPGVP